MAMDKSLKKEIITLSIIVIILGILVIAGYLLFDFTKKDTINKSNENNSFSENNTEYTVIDKNNDFVMRNSS